MSDQNQLEECIRYFRQRKIYDRLFGKVADKYRSLGHFGGTVRLSGLSAEDCRHLGGFFQKDYEGQKTVTISAAAMEKALAGSRFAALKWEDILRGYFGKELVGRKELKQQENAEREHFFTEIRGEAPENPGSLWLGQVLREKGEGYLLLMKHYREQPEKLKGSLLLLLQAIPRLPVLAAGGEIFSHELLAVFAAETTGDPHFFDTGNLGEQLLVSFLKSRFWESLVRGFSDCPSLLSQGLGGALENGNPGGMAGTESSEEMTGNGSPEGMAGTGRPEGMAGTESSEGMTGNGSSEGMAGTESPEGMTETESLRGIEDIPSPAGMSDFKAEEKAALFYGAGLLKDELSNHVLVYGISGVEKDGRPHKGILGYLEQREPLHLTLMTLGKLMKVSPRTGKRIYIVENPAVFAVLAKAWPDAAIVCGNGQIRLATLVLLDLFDEDMEFWYAGDYDPEGLLIAQKLKERYRERLRFWQYRREFYEKYRSDVEISDKSLKKLDRVYCGELQEIRQAMAQQRKAAYQEAMMGEYLADGWGSGVN